MASSSSFSPDVSSQAWKYHVFLSFRGEDTRKTFVDHLYSALKQQGIHTYKDDQTLPRGESIGPSLTKAIEESQIAVVIFSENYADSSWCLDELVCIMKCKDTKGTTVMPIFYGVDPSEVRKQKKKYGEALLKYELENKTIVKSLREAIVQIVMLCAPQEQKREYDEVRAKQELEKKRKVEAWRKALVGASNISGWEPKHVANGHESRVIKEIVDTISQRLQLVTSGANEDLIGMAARVQGLKSKLEIGSGDVLMIGVWGVGGGGKTTLAFSLYDEISGQFDGCSFVNNIREESSKIGLEKLQGKILSGVLKQNEVRVKSVEEGRRMIKDRLCHRKVLIVLDDVDHVDQLKALAGSHSWFRGGSRIIITTRDVHLLIAQRVDVTHNIHLLNDDEAIKLFRKLSPQDYRPKEDYERLSAEVVSYAGGLPLALTVLGSFLCDKDIDEWMSALARLKQIPNDDIIGKLKISYDGLAKVEQDLFLDIACLFRRHNKDNATKILEACGFHPVIGVKVLMQKALITIAKGNFGEECFDMHDLVQEMGNHIVRGEHPNNPAKHSRIWKDEDVRKICAMDETMELDKIQAIHIGYHGVLKKREDLPLIAANMQNVRYIESKAEVANPLFNNVPPRKLICLIMLSGLQKQLWEGCKLLSSLKIMELYGLINLITTPDFDGLPNLETFKLYCCSSLEEIHPSIGRLERLVYLSIQSCESLETFPPETCLQKLKTLSFADCHIKTLRFFLKDLIELDLSYCRLGDEEMGFDVWDLPNLKTLNLDGNIFSRLSFSHLRLPRLKYLNISWCEDLVELSELPSSIAVVKADLCPSLASLGDISNCEWLWNVSLYENSKLDCDVLLDSMFQGNAGEDYFIQIILGYQIPQRFVGRMFRERSMTLLLPDGWYNNFCGFLICILTHQLNTPKIKIVMKQEVDEDPLCEGRQEESNIAVEPPEDYSASTLVGYVSFGSLKNTTTFWSSSYTSISVDIECVTLDGYAVADHCYVGVELVPRKSNKSHQPQTTKLPTTPDSSQFYDATKPFTIQHDSNSSTNIFWQPRRQ